MKYIPLVFVLVLTGCGLGESYMMPNWDSQEYTLITDIRFDSSLYKNECSDTIKSKKNSINLANKTHYFALFEDNLPFNKAAADAANKLDTIAQELKERYNSSTQVGTLYCELKFESITNSSAVIQHSIGYRPR